MLVGAVVFNWNHFAFAGQNIDLAKMQDNRKKLIETSSCPGCELAGVNLSGVNLDRVNLTGANLEGANLSQARLHLATLNKANLQHANLRDVEFGGADLAEADLRGADLKGATFVGAYLVGTQLDKEVSLNQPSEKPVSENIPSQDIAAEKVLPAQEVQGVPSVMEKREDTAHVATQQPSSEVKGKKAPPPSAEPGFFDKAVDSVKGLFGQGENDVNKTVDATGRSVVIPEKEPAVQALPKKDVVADIAPVKEQTPAEVKGKNVPPPSAEPGFFDKTLDSVKGLFGQGENNNKAVAEKHEGDIQEGKQLPGNETAGTQVPENKIDPAAETAKNRERLLETKRCYECNLTGVDLTGKNMDSADLEGADLTGSRLEGVNFENANLKGAILVKVNLRNADLRKADLYKANLSGADLTGAKLDGALLDDAQFSDTVGYEVQGK
ncbi:MAG: pentapeptide repeat-containing protein [Deltaproteobacteria bacterium]|nr:pentapeptide repeat-containing protein [Deltaproteobacteria bacterium]